MPDAQSAILLPTKRANIAEARSDALLDWVRAGGHLIVLTWTLWDQEDREPDHILDPLGVRQFMRSDEEVHGEESEAGAEEDSATTQPEAAEGEADDPNAFVFDPAWAQLFDDGVDCDLAHAATAELEFPDREEPLRARFVPYFWMTSSEPVDRTLEDEFGAHVLSYTVGAGRVTALTDDCFLRNTYIRDLDHAELIWRLARADDRAGSVWFVIDEAFPSAWLLARRYGWPVLVGLALSIGVWIWWRAARFGPRVVERPPERRSLMEHVEAAGRFHWKRGDGESLRDGVRIAVEAAIRARHPGWLQLEPALLQEHLAELTGLPTERIRSALRPAGDEATDQFATQIATLEAIRKAL